MKDGDKIVISMNATNAIYAIGAFILLIGLMVPEGATYIWPIFGGFLWRYYRWLTCIIVVFLYALTRYRFTINKLYVLQLIFFSYILFITLMRKASLREYLTNYLPILCSILLLELFSFHLDVYFKTVFVYLLVLAVFNLIFITLYPDGMYTSISVLGYTKNWLLGYKSSFQIYLYPLFIFSLLNLSYGKWKFVSWFSVLVIYIQTFIAGNMMLLVVISVIAVISLTKIGRISWIYNPVLDVIVFAFLNVFIVSFRFLNISYIYNFLTEVLGKSTTLSGRDYVWANTLLKISNNLIFGYGKVASVTRQSELRGLPHAHNQFLECIYQGGIVGLIIFCLVLFFAMNCIYKNSYLSSSRILGLSVLGILLMGIVEIMMHRNDGMIWVLISLCAFTSHIDEVFKGDLQILTDEIYA